MNSEEFPRVAVSSAFGTRCGFAISADSDKDILVVRFLNPWGYREEEVPRSALLGFVGKTFFPSTPFRPEVCERVTWFAGSARMGRKGWVMNVADNGRVTLAAGDRVIIRWVEQLSFMPLGEGWQEHGKDGGKKEEEPPTAADDEQHGKSETKGGEEVRSKLTVTVYGMEKFRGLFDKLTKPS